MSSKKQTKKIRFRRSKLDAYAHLIGRIPDREVATLAGITPDGVRMYRHRHKIPAYSTHLKTIKKAAAPSAPAASVPTPPRTSGSSLAFQVEVRKSGNEDGFVVIASNIVAAAQRAAAANRGEVIRLTYIAETL